MVTGSAGKADQKVRLESRNEELASPGVSGSSGIAPALWGRVLCQSPAQGTCAEGRATLGATGALRSEVLSQESMRSLLTVFTATKQCIQGKTRTTHFCVRMLPPLTES